MNAEGGIVRAGGRSVSTATTTSGASSYTQSALTPRPHLPHASLEVPPRASPPSPPVLPASTEPLGGSDTAPSRAAAPPAARETEVPFLTTRQPPVCPTPTHSARDWVRLNVGGRVFTTTLATLCADPESVLARMALSLPTTRERTPQVVASARRRRRPGPSDGGEACSSASDHEEGPGDGEPGCCGDGALSQRTTRRRRLDAGEGDASAAPREGPRSADSVAGSALGEASQGGSGGEVLHPHPVPLLPLDVDHHNSILLDLDADHFVPVLNYLRHRVVAIPPHLSVRGVLAVAEYLNIQGMVRRLAPEQRIRRQLLFSWGSGGSGELGTQRFLDSLVPTPVQVTPFGVKVTHVALGANYSCVLSDDGNIYTFGNGEWGQLGLGNPRDLGTHLTDKTAVVVVPRRIPRFERCGAMHISAGYAFAMAIVEGYHVYFWGNNNHGQSGLGPRCFDYNRKKIDEPRLVDTLEGRRIVQLGCGSFFSLALSEDGRLYSWGLIECLGLGTPKEVQRKYQGQGVLGESLSNERRGVVLVPQLVHVAQSAHPLVRIHAGQWHSGAINRAGELFTWGVGYQGRLGHSTKEPAYVPTRVGGALEGHHVVDVACGSFHTVALTDTGAVFCWGDNASGQCGTSASHVEAVTSPYHVVGLEFIAGGRARGISCGRQHTVVVMEGPQPDCLRGCCALDYRGRPRLSHGQVYAFGEGLCGPAGGSPPYALHETGAAAGTPAPAPRTGSGMGLVLPFPSAAREPFFPARTCTQYRPIPGLEGLDVRGVVSGLHHSFVYAEEIPGGAAASEPVQEAPRTPRSTGASVVEEEAYERVRDSPAGGGRYGAERPTYSPTGREGRRGSPGATRRESVGGRRGGPEGLRASPVMGGARLGGMGYTGSPPAP